jgi:hypothetical protein
MTVSPQRRPAAMSAASAVTSTSTPCEQRAGEMYGIVATQCLLLGEFFRMGEQCGVYFHLVDFSPDCRDAVRLPVIGHDQLLALADGGQVAGERILRPDADLLRCGGIGHAQPSCGSSSRGWSQG